MEEAYGFHIVEETSPESEPVSINRVKEALGITDTGSDFMVEASIKGARALIESETQRRLVNQTHYLYLKDWPAAGDPNIDPLEEGDFIQLPFGNTQSITSIEYRDTDGDWQTWADTNYVLDNTGISGRVYAGYNVSWPTSVLYVGYPIRVKFICGYGVEGEGVPGDLISALLLATGELFNNRRFDPKDDGLFQQLIAPHVLYWM